MSTPPPAPLTFGEFEVFIAEAFRESDDLEDTFQFQAKEVERLQQAFDLSAEKVCKLRQKESEVRCISSAVESDISCLKQLLERLELGVLQWESKVFEDNRINFPADVTRRHMYSLLDKAFVNFAYCEDIIDSARVQSKFAPKEQDFHKIVRLLDMFWNLLSQIDKKSSKMEKLLGKIESQRKELNAGISR